MSKDKSKTPTHHTLTAIGGRFLYLRADRLMPLAQREVSKALAEADNEREISSLKARIDTLTAHLDKVYMDKLSGVWMKPTSGASIPKSRQTMPRLM